MASCEGNSSNVPCLATSQTASIPPQAAVVNRQPLSFSISRILGLEENDSQHGNTSNEEHDIRNQESNNNMNQKTDSDDLPNIVADNRSSDRSGLQKFSSPSKSQRKSKRLLSIDSDNPSSDGDSGRESDNGRSSTSSQGRPKKRRNQRTTFSPIELKELEQAFARRPYLNPEDEDDLILKLGLTRRNVRFWFQNRRAKLRRQEKANCLGNVAETGLQNSLYLQFYSTSGKADQSRSLTLPVHARQVHWSQLSPRHTGYSFNAPKQAPCSCCATQSNRFPTAHAPFSSNEEYMTHKPNLFH
ncbi:retinal homeobox protein Rx-B-like [Acropora muricata]|uniref:retinal homeobox protein Rx-B-like n=1 Tax=Acropora muricata TaxID=159855 RepID=UPI0034E5E7F0